MKRTLRCLFLKSALFLFLSCALSAIFTSCPGTAGGGGGNPDPTPIVGITVKGDGNAIVKTSKFTVNKGEKWATVKNNAAIKGVTFKDGFELSEWKLNNASGATLNDSYVFNNPFTTVFAVSKKRGSAPTEKVTITVDGDANVASGKNVNFEVNKGTTWATVKTDAKITGITFNAGFELSEWKLNNGSGATLNDSHVFNANTTVFAVSKNKGSAPTEKVTITVDGDANVASGKDETFEVDKGATWATVKTDAKITGVTFKAGFILSEWKLNTATGETLNDTHAFDDDATVFAVSKDDGTSENKVTITIDGDDKLKTGKNVTFKVAKDSTWEDVSKQAEIASISFEEHYTLSEWKVTDQNGEELLADYVFASDTTVYAISQYILTINDSGVIIGYACEKEDLPETLKIPVTINSKNVTGIGAKAFLECDKIKNWDFEDCVNLKIIEEGAFAKCTNLVQIKFPNSLTEIKGDEVSNAAFLDCTSLTTLDFSNCTALTKISGFSRCSAITTITFPTTATLTEIGKYAFAECKGLTGELNLSTCSGLTKIDESAFRGCVAISSIKFPASLTEIAGGLASSFDGCKGLTGELDLSSCAGLKKVAGFSSCSGITSIKLPSAVEEISANAFSNCSGLTGKLDLSTYNSLKKVAGFNHCASITEVSLPTSVVEINTQAFAYCSKLGNALDLSNCSALTTLDDQSFAFTAITSVKFPATITKLYKTFMGCTKLAGAVDLSACNSLTEIGEMAFSNCPMVTEIKLPTAITKIEKKAFSNCGITTLNLDSCSSLTSIGVEAFADCKSLATVTLPSSVTEIKSDGYAGSFYGCTQAEITLNSTSITTIGKGAFGADNSNYAKKVTVKNEDVKNKVKESGYPEDRINVSS